MEVFINSRKKIIRENQLEILEAQFVDFLEYLGNREIPDAIKATLIHLNFPFGTILFR